MKAVDKIYLKLLTTLETIISSENKIFILILKKSRIVLQLYVFKTIDKELVTLQHQNLDQLIRAI